MHIFLYASWPRETNKDKEWSRWLLFTRPLKDKKGSRFTSSDTPSTAGLIRPHPAMSLYVTLHWSVGPRPLCANTACSPRTDKPLTPCFLKAATPLPKRWDKRAPVMSVACTVEGAGVEDSGAERRNPTCSLVKWQTSRSVFATGMRSIVDSSSQKVTKNEEVCCHLFYLHRFKTITSLHRPLEERGGRGNKNLIMRWDENAKMILTDRTEAALKKKRKNILIFIQRDSLFRCILQTLYRIIIY